MNTQALQQWMDNMTQEHLLVGYGSLLNPDSRQRFSNLHQPTLGVTVDGFSRGWLTRSWQEQQTYVGAVAQSGATLNGQLIPVELDPGLAKREQDYRFRQLDLCQLTTRLEDQAQRRLFDWLLDAGKSLWICETLERLPATAEFPVSQSYVDTCLAGCLEMGGEAEALAFIRTTELWEHPRFQDREAPRYPRAATVSRQVQQHIDHLLEQV